MYYAIYLSSYRKTFRRLSKNGNFPRQEIDRIVQMLVSGNPLPQKYRDHALKGKFTGYRECHIQSDLLLMYRKEVPLTPRQARGAKFVARSLNSLNKSINKVVSNHLSL